jgi:hypothetical protein
MRKEFVISFYYAIDGDDIGKMLEKYILLNDIDGVKRLSGYVDNFLKSLEDYFVAEGADIVFSGGDSLLACSDMYIDISIEKINFGEISFSIGVGCSPSTSLLALKKAKGLGKKRIEFFIGVI